MKKFCCFCTFSTSSWNNLFATPLFWRLAPLRRSYCLKFPEEFSPSLPMSICTETLETTHTDTCIAQIPEIYFCQHLKKFTFLTGFPAPHHTLAKLFSFAILTLFPTKNEPPKVEPQRRFHWFQMKFSKRRYSCVGSICHTSAGHASQRVEAFVVALLNRFLFCSTSDFDELSFVIVTCLRQNILQGRRFYNEKKNASHGQGHKHKYFETEFRVNQVTSANMKMARQ